MPGRDRDGHPGRNRGHAAARGPAVLVASSARIRADLGWAPERDLRSMVADAWAAALALAGPDRAP